jgi:hypothetical protein
VNIGVLVTVAKTFWTKVGAGSVTVEVAVMVKGDCSTMVTVVVVAVVRIVLVMVGVTRSLKHVAVSALLLSWRANIS